MRPECGRRVVVALLVALSWVAVVTAVHAEIQSTDDWVDRYEQLLLRYTQSVDAIVGTRVDYRGLLREPEWKVLIAELAHANPSALESRNEKLAFWINAYNILAMDLVLQNYPVESIRDIGSFLSPVWGKDAGRIGGKTYNLGEIEHEILRPMGEPRIHSAIVCASISCPNLRREPYRAADLSDQLDDNMRAWLARPEKGLAIEPDRNTLWLSPLFDWFEDDFDKQGGVIDMATRYAPAGDRAWLEMNGRTAEVSFFDYDWRLNE